MINSDLSAKTVVYLVILVFIIASSCNPARRTISGNKSHLDVRRSLAVRLDKNRFPGNLLIENADFKYESDKSLSGKITLYIKKDELIFLSVKWMGFEAARLLITPDSLKYIDRFNSGYFFSGSSAIFGNKLISFDFESLQNFIYSGIFFTEDLNMRDLSNLFELVDNELKYVAFISNNRYLELYYTSDNWYLSKLDYRDSIGETSLKCNIERQGNEIKYLNAILIQEGLERKIDIKLNGILDKEFNKTEFKIGKNYIPLENLPF